MLLKLAYILNTAMKQMGVSARTFLVASLNWTDLRRWNI
jgi:hypothetical protein